jgi:hypothetical protein
LKVVVLWSPSKVVRFRFDAASYGCVNRLPTPGGMNWPLGVLPVGLRPVPAIPKLFVSLLCV